MNTKLKVDEVVIDGDTYVPKNSILSKEKAESKDGMPFVVIRTYSAGVHIGYLKRREGKEVELLDSIRIWQWQGAFTLSELAMEGVSDPDNCKFSMAVNCNILPEAIEIIEATEKAKISLLAVEPCKT